MKKEDQALKSRTWISETKPNKDIMDAALKTHWPVCWAEFITEIEKAEYTANTPSNQN